MRILTLVLVMSMAAVACSGGRADRPAAAPTGPPTVSSEVLDAHAGQFNDEVPERLAGSQQEQAAATYLLGHLQQADYRVLLDAVPFRNLFRSTNLVAFPPSSAPPEVVVAAPYDTKQDGPGNGYTLGFFLELARALNVRDARHSVEFVALGAEFAATQGRLGSRRLVAMLADENVEPFVVVLDDIERVGPARVAGDDAAEIDPAASPTATPQVAAEIDAAGLAYAVVSGGARAAGELLLEWLVKRGG